MSAGRFLFRIPNRRGLGHLMRGLNIARELRVLAPAAEVRFHVRAAPPAELWNTDFSYEAEPADAGPGAWAQALAAYGPDVALYDTLLPKAGEWECEPEGFRRAYIMRKWKDDKQAEVFEHPLLRRMDAVIVPHTPEEFGAELPGWLARRMRSSAR